MKKPNGEHMNKKGTRSFTCDHCGHKNILSPHEMNNLRGWIKRNIDNPDHQGNIPCRGCKKVVTYNLKEWKIWEETGKLVRIETDW